jgi:hypothetical protein
VSLNALKHGRYAARSTALRERLVRAGCGQADAFYGSLRSKIAQAFGDQDSASGRRVDCLATTVWCLATRGRLLGTKLESSIDSKLKNLWVANHDEIAPLRYRVEDRWRGIGLAFWVQRRRYLTLKRLVRVLQGRETLRLRGPTEGLERRVRSLCFRLGKPNYEQQMRHGLDKQGNFHPELYAQYRRIWYDMRRQGFLREQRIRS